MSGSHSPVEIPTNEVSPMKKKLVLAELEVVSFTTLPDPSKRAIAGGMEAIQARYTSCIPPDCPCIN